jgi:hypothetical protein
LVVVKEEVEGPAVEEYSAVPKVISAQVLASVPSALRLRNGVDAKKRTPKVQTIASKEPKRVRRVFFTPSLYQEKEAKTLKIKSGSFGS